MKLAFVALAVALLFAGCATTVSPEDAAAGALAKLRTDAGPDGGLQAVAFALDITVPGAANGKLEGRVDYFAQDAFQAHFEVTSFAITNPDMAMDAPDLAGLAITFFCSPDRIVLKLDLPAGAPEEIPDFDHETANDAQTCSGEEPQQVEALAESMVRLVAGALGVPSADFEMPLITFTPQQNLDILVLTDATADGSTVTAVYKVQVPADLLPKDDPQAKEMLEGMLEDLVIKATITDGTMESITANLETLAGFLTLKVNLEADFIYGARPAAPDVRGAETV